MCLSFGIRLFSLHSHVFMNQPIGKNDSRLYINKKYMDKQLLLSSIYTLRSLMRLFIIIVVLLRDFVILSFDTHVAVQNKIPFYGLSSTQEPRLCVDTFLWEYATSYF
ncbi:hypothetical protein BDB01DRAFT_893440 [Pilobolus umbonatus]|nr:hypothetical protein BDB01DRAFT_893440 [Pilobolus umbonatus]